MAGTEGPIPGLLQRTSGSSKLPVGSNTWICLVRCVCCLDLLLCLLVCLFACLLACILSFFLSFWLAVGWFGFVGLVLLVWLVWLVWFGWFGLVGLVCLVGWFGLVWFVWLVGLIGLAGLILIGWSHWLESFAPAYGKVFRAVLGQLSRYRAVSLPEWSMWSLHGLGGAIFRPLGPWLGVVAVIVPEARDSCKWLKCTYGGQALGPSTLEMFSEPPLNRIQASAHS